MGLIDKLLGRSDDNQEPTHECSVCGETYYDTRVICEKCGSDVVALGG